MCTTCGRESPEGFRFCGACGAALGDVPVTVREERKVVSVLFCDLVGFTATTQAADPEDVSRMLEAYHVAVRGEIERFGGVVEKFIGDAAVGVWGAPAAHEDDAERAVRAALAILEAVDVAVRVAVNTGEALVKLDDRLDLGARIVGDVVNTASRLQAVAPVGGILAGEGTVRATGNAITYAQLEPVALKGKPEPVPAWRVTAARSRETGTVPERSAPFLGRDRELRLLQDVWERVVAESALQLVTITGEPGIGKSRLVAEFERWLADQPNQVTCRRGRCLAYGDGIGFWPLSEIVKQQLGLSETATEDEARTRLDAAVEGMTDAPWLRARLAPLVGLPGEGGEREEVFTAWQRFLDEIAARTPLVLIFEDMHWADPALLAFIQRLAEWSTGVPTLALCTSRPELHEAHPGWANGIANAVRLSLGQLDQAATASLAQALLGTALAAGGAALELVQRSGGNPLYAEEYARLLAEHTTTRLADATIPDTVHALIAARIDTLPLGQKELLQDASVIGKVFWAGAVATVGEHDLVQVRADLHELARRQHLRRVRVSTLPGDEEYTFWHDLVHEVAYSHIPRARRGRLHRRTAEWIEALAGDRLADRAELLAHHYKMALDLSSAAGESDTEPLRSAAVRYLSMAGEQAMGLDLAHAARLLADARQLASASDPELVDLLSSLSRCRAAQGDVDGAREALNEARSLAEERGDHVALSTVLLAALSAALIAGDRPQIEALIAEGVQKLGGTEPTRDFAEFLVWAGAATAIGGKEPDAERYLVWASECARRVGDEATVAMAMNFHGMVVSMLGDRKGLDELEQGAQTLESLGSYLACTSRMQVADALLLFDGPRPARPVFEAAIALGMRIRIGAHEMWARAEYAWCLDDEGAWDEMLQEADVVLTWAESHGSAQHAGLIAGRKGRVLALRGDIDAATAVVEPVIDRARHITDPQVLVPTLATAALVAHLKANHSEARGLLHELGDNAGYAWGPTADIGRLLIAYGDVDGAQHIVEGVVQAPPRLLHAITTVKAMLAEAFGDHPIALHLHTEAIKDWRSFENAYELAHALAGQARALEALNRPDEAEAPRLEAEAIFARLGVRDQIWPAAPVVQPSSAPT